MNTAIEYLPTSKIPSQNQSPTMMGEIRIIWYVCAKILPLLLLPQKTYFFNCTQKTKRYQMFLSTLISSILLHTIGSIVLFVRLRSHHYAKWLALLVQLAGLFTPLFLGTVTNALIASILVFSGRFDLSFFVIVSIGLAQTFVVVAVEFLRIVQTL